MRFLIGTSWKMNFTSSNAARYCATLRSLVNDIVDCELFVLPSFTAIPTVREQLKGSNVAWGAQDVHARNYGGHTGDVSAPMLADLGCSYVEVGHSERRRDHGETNKRVAAKVFAVQRWGMTPIVCVGEPEPAPLADVMTRISDQLRLLTPADLSRLVIAYEPGWAIAEGSAAAAPDWAGEVHQAIHNWFHTNVATQPEIPVIYAGSVDSSTAEGFLRQPGVNGLLVGRSGLDPAEFARIVHIRPRSAA